MHVTHANNRTSSRWAVWLLLWLIGVDLRLTILVVPPLLPMIHHDLRLTETLVGVLSGLTTLLFAAAAVPGSLIIARFGARRALVLGLLLTAAASALRGIGPDLFWLFAMTLVMSAGIAIMQPVVPVLVQAWCPEGVGFGTAVYSNGLLLGEAIGAALTLPFMLPVAGGSWRLCLVLWAVPVVLTLLLLPVLRPQRLDPPLPAKKVQAWWPNWRDPRTWQLGFIFGGASALYFGSNAFLPDYLHHLGREDLVGPALSALNVSQIPASLLLLVVIDRLLRRTAFVVIALLGLGSVLGMALLPPIGVVVAAGLAGFCCAFILILSLALPARLGAPGDVARLSAAMFTIAYSMALLMPLLGGFLWDRSGLAASVFAPVGGYLAVVVLLACQLRLPPRPGMAAAKL